MSVAWTCKSNFDKLSKMNCTCNCWHCLARTPATYIPITLYLLRWPNFLGVQYMYHYLVIYFDLPILGCMLHSSIYIQLIVIFHVHIPLLVLCKILHNYTLSGVEIISPVLFLKHYKFFFHFSGTKQAWF